MPKQYEADAFTRRHIEELRRAEATVVIEVADHEKAPITGLYTTREKVTLTHEVGDQVNEATDDSTALYSYVGVLKVKRHNSSTKFFYLQNHAMAVKEFRKAVKNLIKESLE